MQKKQILVVCIANYCRSPVASEILKNRFGDKYTISSAGTIQYAETGMDPRSHEYLKSFIDKIEFHQPRMITLSMIRSCDLVYAIDFDVLMHLNKLFPGERNKFQLFKIKDEDLILSDPFHMNKKHYLDIMEKIKRTAEKINLDI